MPEMKIRENMGNFDHLWLGLFKIAAYHGRNAYLLQESNGELVGGGPVNGRFLRHYIVKKSSPCHSLYIIALCFSLHMKNLE
jgi:hypothetical protein